MVIFLTRFLKRFVVLVPGIVIAVFAIRGILPTLKARLPIVLAVLLTYVIVAYLLIPAAFRLWRTFYPPKHPPIYCLTPDGFASDPINVGVVGSQQALITAMTEAGWTVADNNSPINWLRSAWAVLLKRSYPSAPVSRLFMFGRHQDIGFEIQLDNHGGVRHHVRFWATNFNPIHPLSQQSTSRERILPPTDQPVFWIGAASRDVGYAFMRHNLKISRMVHPDTDRERDLIVHDLSKAGKIKRVDLVRLHEPYQLANRVWRGYLTTDGVMAVCELAATKPARAEATASVKVPSRSATSSPVPVI